MTELSPNTEVVLSSDLFDDDPCLEKMSVPALAVLDAYMTGYGWLDSPTKNDCCGVAAALRAAADQIVPLDYEDVLTDGRILQYEKQDPVRDKLLAIAAELEGDNDH